MFRISGYGLPGFQIKNHAMHNADTLKSSYLPHKPKYSNTSALITRTIMIEEASASKL